MRKYVKIKSQYSGYFETKLKIVQFKIRFIVNYLRWILPPFRNTRQQLYVGAGSCKLDTRVPLIFRFFLHAPANFFPLLVKMNLWRFPLNRIILTLADFSLKFEKHMSDTRAYATQLFLLGSSTHASTNLDARLWNTKLVLSRYRSIRLHLRSTGTDSGCLPSPS